jgi:hypothetical protein
MAEHRRERTVSRAALFSFPVSIFLAAPVEADNSIGRGEPPVTSDEFAALALSLPGVEEGTHFGKRDFRAGGKVFASLPSSTTANIGFTPDQQQLMLEIHRGLYTPLAKSWGARGWTALDLIVADEEIARSALTKARDNVLAGKNKKA